MTIFSFGLNCKSQKLLFSIFDNSQDRFLIRLPIFFGISNSVIDYAGDITEWLIDLVTDAGLLRPADVTNIGSDMHLEVSEIFGP